MVMLRVSHAGKPKVTNLQITSGVQKKVAGLEVPVEDIGGVDVLEAAKNLIEKVADMVIAQPLGLQQLVEICLHETLDDVDILHGVQRGGPQDVPDVNDVLMVEAGQNFNFSQGSLAISLMLKWTDLFDCNLESQS